MSVPMLRAKGKGVGFMVGARVSGGVVEWVDWERFRLWVGLGCYRERLDMVR